MFIVMFWKFFYFLFNMEIGKITWKPCLRWIPKEQAPGVALHHCWSCEALKAAQNVSLSQGDWLVIFDNGGYFLVKGAEKVSLDISIDFSILLHFVYDCNSMFVSSTKEHTELIK